MNKEQTNPQTSRLSGRISWNIYFQTLYYLLVPLICFYCLEFYTHDPWLMAFLPQLINYLLFLAAGLFLYGLTGRSLFAVSFSALFALTAGIANYFVMSFRGNPILPWDFQSIKTALSVSDNYNYEINYRFTISTGVLVLILITGLIFSTRSRKRLFTRIRFGTCAAALAFLILTSLGMMNHTITSWLLTPTNLFTQWASYRDNGFVVTFLQNMQYVNIRKPADYNTETLDQELQDFLAFHTDSSVAPMNQNEKNSSHTQAPHIIVIMDESFADLSVLHDFDTNEDYMPYIHSLQKENRSNLITGNLFVSVCGGNTANTEFEFLTGNTTAFLPPGSVAFQQYIHEELPGLASQLATDNYTTIGLHPYSASGWNRNLVYPLLGFEQTCFRDSFYPARIVRKYISDETAFNKLTTLYKNRNTDENLFLFEVTMQNHGGYSEIFDNFPVRVKLTDIHTGSSFATENYLTLVQESDRAFRQLISTFEAADEPVIIMMFGDHQPNDFVSENIASLTGVKKDDRSLEESQNRYIVPYVIWANFDLDKTYAGLSDHSGNSSENTGSSANTLSVNYLGACLTRLAGRETTDYQDFLLYLKETLPVITANVVIDRDGNYMTMEEAKDIYPELINLYEKLQYRMLFDR